MIRQLGFMAILLLGIVLTAPHARAETFSVTDIAGRTTKFEKPIKRIILGEGRYITTIALFDRDNPVKRVVGMLNDLQRSNPKFSAEMKQKFPEFSNIELFGEQSADSVSAEKILSLKPDLAIFGIQDHGPGAKNKELLAQLKAGGVKVVFIDFRLNPLKNTLPSLKILGKVLGHKTNGQDYINYYIKRLDRIENRIKAYNGPKPTAFLQAHVGRFECCVGMAKGMLGPYLEFVGATNISSRVAVGPTTRHTMEFLLEQNPDIWIATASGTKTEYQKGKAIIFLGPDATKEEALTSLKRATSSPAMQTLKAVKTGRAHGIWHNFYNSPLNIVAVESLAKWVHPALFKDIEPEQTMEEIYNRFLPFTAGGIYSVTLTENVRHN